jgi:hypothetical protein
MSSETPLHNAASTGNVVTIREVGDGGHGRVRAGCSRGEATSPLHMWRHGHVDAVRVLVEVGAEVASTAKGSRPLHAAACQAHVEERW